MTNKRPTSFDVARLAGVSRTTVSFVLNGINDVSIPEKTRRKVIDAAKQLNYHPDAAGRILASGKTKNIGLVQIQNSEQVFMDAFLLSVLVGIEQNASQRGFHVLLKNILISSEDQYSQLILENRVDGIILSGPRQDDRGLIELHESGVPIMLLGQMPNTDIPFVDVDARKGAESAVNFLVEHGYKQIAMITNAPMQYTSAQQRRQGYVNSLTKAGLPINEEWFKEGEYTPASGFQAAQELLAKKDLPDAIFVASDVVAMGVYRAIKQENLRIPEDIAVVGFDDIPMSQYFDPPLTTVHLPGFNLGWAAGDRLIRLIMKEGLDVNGFFLETELIKRESTK